MQKSIWIFGILAGIICAVLEYLFFGSQDGSANVMFMAKIAVLVIFTISGLVLIRKLKGGIISISRTILSGLMIALIRAVVMIIAFGFLYYPNGEFYKFRSDQAIQVATNQMNANEAVKPADKEMKLEETIEQITFQYKPKGYSLIAVGSSIITGLIISILTAAIIGTNMMYNEPEQLENG
jgi:cytochrome b subunit of formate dehydrogenase